MLNLNGIIVRLGGRTILDRATAALPPYSRIGLIGRNGAGKSTLMKVMIGTLEADDGSLEMPKGTRIGYIAQEAPAGDSTPFDTVLAADTERAALMIESEQGGLDHDRMAEVHERLIAIDAYTAPARASRILVGLGFDEDMQGLWRPYCFRSRICCCSMNRRTTWIWKQPCGSRISSRAILR
jgi:ATP-binding cassette, subfamily F, member 3